MLEVLPKYARASKEQKERGIIRDNISQIQSNVRANKKPWRTGRILKERI